MKDKKQNTLENLEQPDSNNFSVVKAQGSKPLEYNNIYNGDSFELCERVPAETVDLILEDMPYNMTSCKWDVKIDLKLYWETRLRILKPTGVVVLTGSQPFTTDLINSNRSMFKYSLVWDKGRPSGSQLAKIRPLKYHEDIIIFYNKFGIYNPQMTRGMLMKKAPGGNSDNYRDIPIVRYESDEYYPRSIIDIKGEHNMTGKEHPTQKPVGLFEYLIRTYTNEGDLVFDGFGGSGTTAIAAHRSKRNFIVIEKEKKYFDLAVRRLDIERAQYTIF